MGISVLFLTEEECLIIKQPLSQSLIGNTAVRLWPPYTSPVGPELGLQDEGAGAAGRAGGGLEPQGRARGGLDSQGPQRLALTVLPDLRG